jgi:branched-chain amino acid transport system substrate-binding protein
MHGLSACPAAQRQRQLCACPITGPVQFLPPAGPSRRPFMNTSKLAGLALCASLALPAAALAQDITIAVAAPLTGSEAVSGRQMTDGATLAVADINAAGGVLGRKLKFTVNDDACDPKQARSVAEKVAGAKVSFVVGHFCSASSIAASEVYADANIAQISPASTATKFTEGRLWNVARVCGRDDQQGPAAAAHIMKAFAGKNIAILHDKNTYGKGLADETKKALNAAGFREKMFESFNRGDVDFSAIVSRLKREQIDLVYVGSYPQEAGLLLRQMREQGLKTVLMAGDALYDRAFASITGPEADGALFTFGPDPRRNPAAKAVVDRFVANKVDPEGYTLHTYAAIQVWAQAVAKAGATDARKVMQTIKAGEWDTVMGKLSFDAKGDIKQTGYVLWKWDGKGNAAELASGKGS